MVKLSVTLEPTTMRVLEHLKIKYGLKNDSEAVDKLVDIYYEEIMELELRPEYIERAKRIKKEDAIHIGSIEDFYKEFGL